ncbi:S8 family serine peptidase [Umezawaea sp.]|uniref:S8 family serine peptidase n=1 Tax=Umezawaea sp. TaxID=1955258 RepID=UPI002ED63331
MKLEPSLQHAVAVWRTELGHAAEGVRPRLAGPGAESRRVTVLVRYSGDVEALRRAGLDTGYDSGGVVSGIIALADLDRLDAVPGVESVSLVKPPRPSLDDTVEEMRVPWKVPPTTPWPGRGAGVIVAVIDTGIDVFHESFRNTDADKTTRILELWDQGAKPTDGGLPPPAGFQQIGRLYQPQHINAALKSGQPFASVDEDGHGTHVAGIAAGDGSQDDRCSSPGTYTGVAPEADLVVVKAIASSSSNVPDAMRWCAQAGGRHAVGNPPVARPVVVNCSFGFSTGPHDGTDALDWVIDDVLRPTAVPPPPPPPGVAFVVAAGNSGVHEIHESGTVPAGGPGGTATVRFRVPENSLKVDLLDIWYTGAASLNIELIAPVSASFPGTVTTGVIAPVPVPPAGTPPRTFTIGRMTLTVTSLAVQHGNGKKQIEVTIAVPADTAVREGEWRFTLTNTTSTPAVWDAWFEIEHGDAFPTFRLESEPDRVESRRVNTINSPGTSRNAITVASYADGGGELADSSSRGLPTQAVTPPGEIKPTVAAPGVAVAAPRSRLDKDSNSSCCDQLVLDSFGTSMASPHVAGLVALMFQKNRNLTFVDVREKLQKSCRVDGIPAAEVPPVIAPGIKGNHLWGSGKVDAAAALNLVTAAAASAASGGGGGAPPLAFAPDEIGLTPHTLRSRVADLHRRFGPRPGVQLFASLVSEHVDEVLRLVNTNRRVLVAWRRLGGPQVVRRLLHGPAVNGALLPEAVDGLDVHELVTGFLAVLDRFAGPRLRADLVRFADFVRLWPGGSLDRLDEAALDHGAGR